VPLHARLVAALSLVLVGYGPPASAAVVPRITHPAGYQSTGLPTGTALTIRGTAAPGATVQLYWRYVGGRYAAASGSVTADRSGRWAWPWTLTRTTYFYPRVAGSGSGRSVRANAAAADPAPRMLTGFITGYTLHDNDPPGSRAIAHPGPSPRHRQAGGVGTYVDPISLAAQPGDFPPGTRVYIPHVQRYFIVEDDCASCGARPQWIDMWIGGGPGDRAVDTDACARRLTGNYQFEVGPPPNRPVRPGEIFRDGACRP
jgi:hypothetical protein